jgi:hypothetical protein
MTDKTDAKAPPYGEESKRKSRNLLYLLGALTLFATVVFSLLYAFGRNFGVQV